MKAGKAFGFAWWDLFFKSYVLLARIPGFKEGCAAANAHAKAKES